MDEVTTTEARSRFAKAITSAAGVDDDRISQAFAKVPREQFLGRGPWMILSPEGYVETKTADPALLYDDIVVALSPEKRINNGQPSLHARCLSAARIRPSEKVLHIGCGAGYYSAVISELVTSAGTVAAWDVEATLVNLARRNLRSWENVTVSLRSGTAVPIPESDVIYVCAGCTQPLRAWADALSDGGRLLFPLTPGWDYGGMLMITRAADRFKARFVCKCSFIPCIGGSSNADEALVREAFASGNMEGVSSLQFGNGTKRDDAWLVGDGWWLSTREQVNEL